MKNKSPMRVQMIGVLFFTWKKKHNWEANPGQIETCCTHCSCGASARSACLMDCIGDASESPKASHLPGLSFPSFLFWRPTSTPIWLVKQTKRWWRMNNRRLEWTNEWMPVIRMDGCDVRMRWDATLVSSRFRTHPITSHQTPSFPLQNVIYTKHIIASYESPLVHPLPIFFFFPSSLFSWV